MLKNMKVSKKLIVSFLVVTMLTAVVGIMGIMGMRQIDSYMEDMYTLQTEPIPDLAKAIEMLQRQRACMREYIVGAAIDDMGLIEDAHKRVEEYRPIMYTAMDAYVLTIRSDEARALFLEARDLYDKDFRDCIQKIYESAKAGVDASELYNIMGDYTAATNKIVDNFDVCMEMKLNAARDAADASSKTANTLLAATLIVLVIAFVISMYFAIYVSGIISRPVIALSKFLHKAGATGDITLSPEEERVLDTYSQTRDEIGQMVKDCNSFIHHIAQSAHELDAIANGDLTIDVVVSSSSDTLGISLKKMSQNLNDMLSQVHQASSQVTMGATQIADGAQALASGATEQAATLEEISASISDISERTRENAEKTGEASNLAETIMRNAEKGSRQMEQMISAVDDINHANQSISKVIKAIDDIAFQTNILALNAAVEAARAGAAGKGFAVVAEEVRNLAAKSAESAKDTGSLIANSMEKAKLGTQIAGETSASLNEIVSGIGESNKIISEIAQSSEQQTMAISQINVAVGGVTQVVQQNSATAEESAAASEEMSGQAGLLESLIAQFKLKN
ncbi:MAG: methyl-accepting chemotaxis protein [Oscillospiraceae bacterium]|nr:methyl-accepting chemotaxis protein [Oscillospiraceae bacterium]